MVSINESARSNVDRRCAFVHVIVWLSILLDVIGAFQLPGALPFSGGENPAVNTRRRSPSLSVIKDETGTLATDDQSKTSKSKFNHISIEYCTGCRWMLKSFWLAQELLSTFGKNELDAVTVIPSFDTQGKFVIQLSQVDLSATLQDTGSMTSSEPSSSMLWDRQEQGGGFPSSKDVKQMVRDSVNPEMYLGHSDTEARQSDHQGDTVQLSTIGTATTTSKEAEKAESSLRLALNPEFMKRPSVTIHYCTGCQWLLRAAYLGQELLTTFNDGELKSVTLVPSKPPEKGGRFSVDLNGDELFDRKTEGRFPEPKEIKQMIRDRVVPEMDLGHSDVEERKLQVDEAGDSDDDDAEEARKYFGVM